MTERGAEGRGTRCPREEIYKGGRAAGNAELVRPTGHQSTIAQRQKETQYISTRPEIPTQTTVRASAERAIPSVRRDDIRRDASRKMSLQKATSSTGTQRVGVQLQGSPSTCEVFVDASIGVWGLDLSGGLVVQDFRIRKRTGNATQLDTQLDGSSGPEVRLTATIMSADDRHSFLFATGTREASQYQTGFCPRALCRVS
ncbi:hypothetical protein EV126DRAFT_63776 [Verticillium dahliae]|nr:hypothetical protein EV126DRAFT_63776 [Verticillium dahliae]